MAAKKKRSKKPAPRSRRKHPEATRPQPEQTAERGEIISAEVAEERVQEVATHAVSQRTVAMIENLAEKAEAGDPVSIKALLELMRGKKQPQSKAGKNRSKFLGSLVDQWKSEREWQSPAKSDRETAPGNK